MRASFLNKAEDTFAAGLDVRVKLLLCATGSVASLVFSSPLSLGLLLILTTLLALGATRPVLILKVYLFTILMMLFSLGFAALIAMAVPGLMKWDAYSLSTPFLRMLISINLLLTLSLSTPVRVLFARLQATRLPGWIHIPLSVAIRFIPTFMSDCAQIRDAARLRPGRGLTGLWRGLAVPLLFRMLYSAEDLAVAAELKGISAAGRPVPLAAPGAEAEKRTGLCAGTTFPLSGRDRLVLCLTALALGAAIVTQYYGPQFMTLPM